MSEGYQVYNSMKFISVKGFHMLGKDGRNPISIGGLFSFHLLSKLEKIKCSGTSSNERVFKKNLVRSQLDSHVKEGLQITSSISINMRRGALLHFIIDIINS